MCYKDNRKIDRKTNTISLFRELKSSTCVIMKSFLIILFVACSLNNSLCFTECDAFGYGELCSLQDLNEILNLIPGLANEIFCQEECTHAPGCLFFQFEVLVEGSTRCILLKSCNSSNTPNCDHNEQCKMSVIGPVKPDLVEACCETFSNKACPSEFQISEFFHVTDEQLCQNLCRNEEHCR